MHHYELIRSKKRSTISIEVHRDSRVVVRAPLKVSQKEILQLVTSKTDWINKQKLRQSTLPQKRKLNDFSCGSEHFLLGNTLKLKFSATPSIIATNDEIQLPIHLKATSQSETDGSQVLDKKINAWYRTQAKIVLRDRFDMWKSRILHWDTATPQLRLRFMKRYWGNCRSTGWITLNTHLVKLPISLIDYVISHEMCHLIHMNHSPKFYELHSSLMSDWKDRRNEIRQWELLVLP